MDFVRLGEAYSTSYLPDILIEGYNSLIWTERYLEPGEFEVKSFDVEGLSALLPEDTLVSHLETREVMMVETQEINMVGEGADAVPEITIRGRSALTILEHRWVESTYQKKRRMRQKYSSTSAAGVLLFNAVDNSSGVDVTRGDNDPDTKVELNDYSWNTSDAIPNIAITESVPAEGKLRWWQLEEGMLYPQLKRILDSQGLGLRLIRPVDALTPGTIIKVRTVLWDRGTIIRTAYSDIRQLQFNIYQGLDRSTGSNMVRFILAQGHLEKPSYLKSKKDYKSEAEVMAGEGVRIRDIYRAGESGLTGWARRTMGFDAGSPELPPEPDKPDELRANATKAQKQARAKAMDDWIDAHAKWKNKKNRIVADFKEEQVDAALNALRKQRRINMFSADVTSLAPYKYKTHYDLGDTVMLYGDYGYSAKMVVSEYVRTEDVNGDRGFPGLVEPLP